MNSAHRIILSVATALALCSAKGASWHQKSEPFKHHLSTVVVLDTLNGEIKRYYKSGQLLEQYTLVNGIWEGKRTIYYSNGQVDREMTYHQGQLDGLYKGYDKTGRLQREIDYTNGVFSGIWAFYDKGAKSIEAHFKNGKIDGWYYQYHRNGIVHVKTFYDSGQIISGESIYRKDGSLEYELISNKDHNRLVMKVYYDKVGQTVKREKVELKPLTYYLFGAQVYE